MKKVVSRTLIIFGVMFFVLILIYPVCNSPWASRRLEISGSGGRIARYIIAANTQREAEGKDNVWPTKDAYKTSNEFFASLLADDVLDDISLATFAGANVRAARNLEQFRTGNHNLWNVVAGLNDADPDELPFMFTKNFSITAEELMNADSNDNTTDWSHKITKSGPVLSKSIVVVSKGSVLNDIHAKWLTPAAVLNGARYTNDIEILKAVD